MRFQAWVLFATAWVIFSGCSSGPAVKKQQYAKLGDHRVFEYEFPVVWKGIESALRNYRITDRDPKQVDANEMRRLRQRSLESDWVFSRSNDKYIEYKINDIPRKQYLQTRLKYNINAQSVIGGVDVTVKTDEEIEKLNDDGSPAGWEKPDEIDTSRSSDLLDKINLAILSAP